MQSLETKSSRPRPKSFETKTRPETFETETPWNRSRDTSRDRDQASRLHHWGMLYILNKISRYRKVLLEILTDMESVWNTKDGDIKYVLAGCAENCVKLGKKRLNFHFIGHAYDVGFLVWRCFALQWDFFRWKRFPTFLTLLSRDEDRSRLDRTGSGLKLSLAGSCLDRIAIFFRIGGSGLDRTEKIFVVLKW